MASVIVIFDFDSTIIECDSDNWVLDEFGLTEKFYQLLPNMLWNPLMVFFTFHTFISSNTMLFYFSFNFFSSYGNNFLVLIFCRTR
jgi:hypothetical protein